MFPTAPWIPLVRSLGSQPLADTVSSPVVPAATANAKPANNFPPPKTDKPRPHVCTTCQRSFARLEHLKRHERSHTKEKPFECPECARCFARRDLLLRHQQKLHQTSTPSSRPRNRRESASGVTPAQARRKSSIAGASPVVGANASTASMRPRANTISHVDINAMQMIASATASAARGSGGHNRHPSLSGLPANAMHGLGLSLMNQRGLSQTLGKLDTATLANGEFDAGLRTAPTFTPDFDFENFVFGSGSTINPNALHYSDSAHSVGLDQRSPFPGTLNDISSTQTFEDNFDWVTGFENQINIRSNENVIDGSSPSAISTTSQSGMSDVMVDGSNQPLPASTSNMWQPSVMGPPQLTNPFAMDLNGSVFPDLLNGAPVSPQPASQKINDPYLSAPQNSMRSLSPSEVSTLRTKGTLHHSLGLLHAVPDVQPTLPPGNNGASPVTTITEATRTAIVNTLSHRQNFGGRKRTLVTSPSAQGQVGMGAAFNLPSIQDLQRYVGSYLSYFHPHFPFLHLPTLSFDMSAAPTDEDGALGGRGCLLLAISMIGALYAGDSAQSKDLFEMSKKMIFLFLEERRKAEMDRHADAKARRSASAGGDHSSMPSDDGADTPVWLVQAMLLNVSYGHNVIDKIATSIASTHCIALVSLAQAAGLGKQIPLSTPSADIVMSDDPNANWSKHAELLEHQQWVEWSRMEERKRTMYAVFILSSLLVTAYNHAPPLTNSEISLDLPCDEEFFAAESSTAFFAKGGVEAAAHNTVPFSEALAELLHAGERNKQQSDSQGAPASELKTSSVGCLLLIYALHNYIWETRQRHQNEIWTTEETEKMHRHIEPALRAWQILWANNPQHSVAQPNAYGLGPASSDAIPLLDLAYVRLFIELAGAKERFWDRDWDGMAAEIAKGSQLVPVAGRSPGSNDGTENTDGTDASAHGSVFSASPANQSTTTDGSMNKAPLSGVLTESEKLASRREKHLRKASFFAADSLAMSESLGFAMSTTHGPELALPAALCIFECAQVLIEWVATVQDRVGAYIGIMGKDEIDFGSMPAIMVLEDDDVKLLEKVQNMIAAAETKIRLQLAMDGNEQEFVLDNAGGFCSKLLQLLGMMFDKAGVWQVYNLMSQCALAQVAACTARAQRSVAARVG